jgi:small-conductance mechanosensitive channel
MAKQAKGQAAEPAAEAPAPLPAASIAGHPRAKAAIRRARSRTALAAFVLVLLFGHHAGLTWFDATWRALAAGIAANVVAWRCALFVWRALIVAELRQAEETYAERRRTAVEALERRAAAAAEAANAQAAGFQAA